MGVMALDQSALLGVLRSVVRRLASEGLSSGEVPSVFKEQLARLDMAGMLLLSDQAGERLRVHGVSLPDTLASGELGVLLSRVLESEGGALDRVEVFERVVSRGEPEFIADLSELLRPWLFDPNPAPRPASREAPDALRSVCLPLNGRCGGVTHFRGLLVLAYPGLHRGHLPLLEMFAAQWASALVNLALDERLRDSEQQLRNVFDSLDSHMAVVAADGEILEVNRAWRDFALQNRAGDESAWGVGANYFSVAGSGLQGDSSGRDALDGIRRVVAGEIDVYESVYPCHSPDQERWFHMRVLPVVGGSNTVLVLHTDMTYRKLVERALRDREQTLRSVFRAAPVGIGILRDRVFVTVNRSFCSLVGYEENELIGRNARMIYFSDQDYDRVGRDKYAMIREQGVGAVETRVRHKNGEARDVWLSSAWLDASNPSAGVTFTALDISERKRADSSLRESEERFRTLFENTAAGWVRVDQDGVIVDVNPAFAGMLGFLPSELRGRTIQDLTHPDDWQINLAEIEAARSGANKAYQIEKRYLRRDGSALWCLVSANWTFDTDGNPTGVVALVQDIDQRKRIEADLVLFRALVDQMVDSFLVVDPISQRILDCNSEACRRLAYERESLIGKLVPEVSNMFDDGEPSWNQFVRHFPVGGQEQFECEAKRSDGILFPVEVRMAHVGVGSKRYLVGVIRDISERQAMERQLKQRTAELEVLLNMLPAPVYMKDRDLRLQAVNRAYCEFVGRSREQVLGREDRQLYPEEVAAAFALSDRSVLKGGEGIIGLEQCLQHSDGRWRWFSTAKMPLLGPDGEVIGLVGTSVDITDVKEAETRRLEQEKKNRDTLIREVHHRIKNHLQGVVGLLRRHLDDDDHGKSLRQAINQIGAIATVYGLQSSQPDSGIRFCDMVASVVDLHKTISDAAIEFSRQVSTPARLGSEEAVPVALIVNEIMTNALKHSSEHQGTGSVQVELRVEAGLARLRVRNPGTRLPDGFDLATGKGLGTGLQLVRSLLPPRGAKISIQEVGQDVHAQLDLVPPVISEDRQG